MPEPQVIEVVHEKDPMGRIVWGLLLIAFGVLYLLSYLGMMPWIEWNRWWPLLVVAFGLARLVTARTAERLGGSVTGILTGAWFLAVVHHWHGLTWMRAWPLALVAIGAGWVVRGIAAPFMRAERGRIDVSW